MAQSKEEKNAKERERYWKNRDHVREMHSKWHAANRATIKARKKLWHMIPENVIKRRGYDKKKYAKNPLKKLMYNRQLRYGLTEEGHAHLMQMQNKQCAICKKPITVRSPVDHCHTTGRIRGLLCFKCNTGLGMFGDNVELLETVIQYLKGK